jgi:hypothetical protein
MEGHLILEIYRPPGNNFSIDKLLIANGVFSLECISDSLITVLASLIWQF